MKNTGGLAGRDSPSSINPNTFGQSVTFTATLPTNTTGTVTFTNGATVLGTSAVTNGVATVTTSALAAGSDPITATYNGDSNNSTATASLTQTVNKTTQPVTVTTSGPVPLALQSPSRRSFTPVRPEP